MTDMNTNDKDLNNETLSRLMDGEWQDLNPGECLAVPGSVITSSVM